MVGTVFIQQMARQSLSTVTVACISRFSTWRTGTRYQHFLTIWKTKNLLFINSDSEDFDADYDMFSRDSDSNE